MKSPTEREAAPPAERFADVLKGHVACKRPATLIERATKEFVTDKGFQNAHMVLANEVAANGFPKNKNRFLDKPMKLALASSALMRVESTCYEPGGPEINAKGAFNMWLDPGVEPLAEEPTIFLDHIYYLIPDPREREIALDWMAWTVQHPDKKIQFALLVFGEGGTGKSWLGTMFQFLFGHKNVAKFTKEQIAEAKFNAEKEFKRLHFYDEVESKKIDLAHAIATEITELELLIERKGVDKFWTPNHANILAVSNKKNPIRMRGEHTRRRWCCVEATDDKRYTDDRGQDTSETAAYYGRLHGITPSDGGITDELRRIVWFFSQRDLSDFNPNNAPITDAQVTVAEAGMSAREADLVEMWNTRCGPFRFNLFTIAEVMRDVRLEPREDVKQVEADVVAFVQKLGGRRVDKQQRMYGGNLTRLWARSKKMVDDLQAVSAAELRARYDSERSDPQALLFDDVAMFGPAAATVAEFVD
jgi:hypothetical protein